MFVVDDIAAAAAVAVASWHVVVVTAIVAAVVESSRFGDAEVVNCCLLNQSHYKVALMPYTHNSFASGLTDWKAVESVAADDEFAVD